MIHAGDRLENLVTGEVLVFHRTSEETDGESVLLETIVRAAPDQWYSFKPLWPTTADERDALARRTALPMAEAGGAEVAG